MRTIEEIQADLTVVQAELDDGRAHNGIQKARLLQELAEAEQAAEPSKG